MKKILSLVLAAVMVASMFAGLQVSSSALSASGQCGDDVYWSFNKSTGKLTISGTGDMYDYCEDSPFFGNDEIISVEIENGVTNIGDGVFDLCDELVSVTIPDSVVSIGDLAFANCYSFMRITIPDSVSSIGEGAFDNTAYYDDSKKWENNVLYIGNHLIEANRNISGEYAVKSGTKTIVASAFMNRRSLTSITIPDSVTSIGGCAFYGCSGLTSVTIPDSVTSIKSGTFCGCISLNELTMPASAKIDGYFDTFDDCTNLEKVTLTKGTGTMPNYSGLSPWSRVDSLKEVVIENGVKNISDYAFNYCKWLTTITISDSVKSIGTSAFSGCTNLTSVTMSKYVTNIGDEAFEACFSLTSITIPDSVTSIGEHAFAYCNALTSVIIGNSVKTIDNYEFHHCTGLTSAIIGKSVTSIGTAFSECTALTTITIPVSVKSIGSGAFFNCTYLKDVYYDGTKKQWNKIEIDEYCIQIKLATIHCSDGIIHPHSFIDVVTSPTCTEQGYITHTCECGEVVIDTYVPALGHKFEADKPYCLNGCGTANPNYIIPVHVHLYKEVVTAPKVAAVGYTQYKCICGEWKKDAKGNVFKDKFTAPTGKSSGFKCASRTATAEKFTWAQTAGVSGYQVQLLNSAGKSAGTATTTGNAYTFSKLAAGHAYKARVRFFIKAADGKNYYGAWATINSPTLPAATNLVKVTGAKKAFTAQWKKGAVTGYQLQYSLKSNFSGAKSKAIKGASKLKLTIKSLQGGKKYFVRVRTYKTIGGKNYYSAWSGTKTVTTKK